MSIMQLQQRVLSPEAGVDYSTIIMQSYPAYAIQREPFIGFKIKCRDTQVSRYYGAGEERMKQIDAFLQQTNMLVGTGVILRATHFEMPDGIWVITMPAPRSFVMTSLQKLFSVLQLLEQRLGIVMTGEDYEICVSGRCLPMEVESTIGSLHISPQYLRYLREPTNTAFKYGHLIRINDVYACFRTRWNPGLQSPTQIQEFLMMLSQLISAIFH